MPVALATAAVTAGASVAANKFLGGDSKKALSGLQPGRFRSPGFSGGGLNARFQDGQFNVTDTGERRNVVSNIGMVRRRQAAELRAQRALVAPGVSGLREARLNRVRDARQRGIGNLRENLAQRRIAGSSFAADAQSRAEAEFGRQEADVEGETFLQELQLTNTLISQEATAAAGEFQALLDEFNVQSAFGAKLAIGATPQVGANARQSALLASQDLQGIGAFLEPSISALGDAAGEFVAGEVRPLPTRPLFGGRNRTGVPVDAAGRAFGGV